MQRMRYHPSLRFPQFRDISAISTISTISTIPLSQEAKLWKLWKRPEIVETCRAEGPAGVVWRRSSVFLWNNRSRSLEQQQRTVGCRLFNKIVDSSIFSTISTISTIWRKLWKLRQIVEIPMPEGPIAGICGWNVVFIQNLHSGRLRAHHGRRWSIIRDLAVKSLTFSTISTISMKLWKLWKYYRTF